MNRLWCILIVTALASCGPQQPQETTPAPAIQDAAGPGEAGAPQMGSFCSPDGWCWQNPVPQGNALSAIWGSNPNDIYAVGVVGAGMVGEELGEHC